MTFESEKWERHVHICGPIDDWVGWRYIARSVIEGAEDPLFMPEGMMVAPSETEAIHENLEGTLTVIGPTTLATFNHEFHSAKLLAKSSGWEGDGFWLCTVLPDPEYCASTWVFAVKQSNDGTAYIVSKYQMPWLDGEVKTFGSII